jgi:hypothetical protein
LTTQNYGIFDESLQLFSLPGDANRRECCSLNLDAKDQRLPAYGDAHCVPARPRPKIIFPELLLSFPAARINGPVLQPLSTCPQEGGGGKQVHEMLPVRPAAWNEDGLMFSDSIRNCWNCSSNPKRRSKAFLGSITVFLFLCSCGLSAELSVGIVEPGDGARLRSDAPITLKADAQITDGVIAKVEFFVDGVVVGEALTAPYECYVVCSMARAS